MGFRNTEEIKCLFGKREAFWMHLYFGLTEGGMVIVPNVSITGIMVYGLVVMSGWWIVPMVMCTMGWWILASQVMRQLLIENVLLYMYCKDFNGEKLPLEIEDKFSDEIVYLSLHDEKNHVIV
ncbi:hypothetical protein FXO38_11142 [Capsicum annuum]|nr:hypothetical protein FXO38_11142 [Capsicum annuum]KAF3681180.1 hypothetical protein FXO37_03016 [Capsicum annuum]